MEEQTNQANQQPPQSTVEPPKAEPKDEDVEKNKGIATAAYLIFFLPLILAKESKYARYHANQALVLFLLAIVINIVAGILPFFGPMVVGPLGGLACLVLAIVGMVNAWGGQKKPLPFIGHIEILK